MLQRGRARAGAEMLKRGAELPAIHLKMYGSLFAAFPNHQFIAVGNDTAFFSYSSRLGNFILARFA
jgi:hypothetical protein